MAGARNKFTQPDEASYMLVFSTQKPTGSPCGSPPPPPGRTHPQPPPRQAYIQNLLPLRLQRPLQPEKLYKQSLGRWCPDPRTAIIVLLRIPERIDCVRIRPIPNIHHFHPPNYFELGHAHQPLEKVVAL